MLVTRVRLLDNKIRLLAFLLPPNSSVGQKVGKIQRG